MLNPWTIAENLPEKTRLIANHLGCPVDNNRKMVECLRNRPASLIANAVGLTQVTLWRNRNTISFQMTNELLDTMNALFKEDSFILFVEQNNKSFSQFQPYHFNPFSPWGPTVDSFAKDPALADYPAELMKQGRVADVSWLCSVVTNEGLYPAAGE